MSNDIITTDLQSQSVDSALVELFELDLGNGTILFFHSGLDENLGTIKFHPVGEPAKNTNPSLVNEYEAMPIMMDGIEANSDGASNRPTLTVANVSSLFRGLLDDEDFGFEDLIGTRITRRQTFQKYLHGEVSEDAPFELPIRTYLIDRVSSETSVAVTFELAAPFDVSGIKIPNRIVVGKYCTWLYQGYDTANKGGCFWSADSKITYDGVEYEAFFDLDNRPLVSSTLSAPNWSAGTYDQDDFVTYDSKIWRSEVDSNTNTPGTGLFWKQVLTWSVWSSSTTYSVDNYVKYNDHIWRARLAGTNKEPKTNSLYWTRVDYCNKELSGCKARFQFKPTTGGYPSADKRTTQTLPFGAYPGSAKFK